MIVVVEGISAAGKTRWCREHAGPHLVEEARPAGQPPDRRAEPEAASRFWIEQNAHRWRLARETEARSGLAVCDTDPLKLHYAFCLSRIGALGAAAWRFERDLTRTAVEEGRLGFADLYLIKRIEPKQARRQRDADPARGRRNFELHLRLQEPLVEWYRAVEAILPGRVAWGLPAAGLPHVEPRPGEDDRRLFEALIERLA